MKSRVMSSTCSFTYCSYPPETIVGPSYSKRVCCCSDMMGDPHMMMPPRPGMHMMGRGGYPPHGPPMDFYYHPYMEDYYAGGGRPPYGEHMSAHGTH